MERIDDAYSCRCELNSSVASISLAVEDPEVHRGVGLDAADEVARCGGEGRAQIVHGRHEIACDGPLRQRGLNRTTAKNDAVFFSTTVRTLAVRYT